MTRHPSVVFPGPRRCGSLERTADDGMPAYELFASDPTLTVLKGLPAFDALMQKLRADSERYRQAYREVR